MDIKFVTSTGLERHATQSLVIPVYEGEDRPKTPGLPALLGGRVRERVLPSDVRAKPGAWTLAYPGLATGPLRVMFLGIGKEEELTTEKLRRFAGSAVRVAEQLEVAELTVYVRPGGGLSAEETAQAVAEGLLLAAWQFTELKGSAPEDGPATAVTSGRVMMDVEHAHEGERGVQVGTAVARGENFARLLQSRPGNVATPTHLADEAVRIAEELGLASTILGPRGLRDERMHALLAVSQGSDQEPRLIVLEHRGANDDSRPLVLVGKGLTFDAGGISIKPAKGMEEMKFDMSGGAAVLGAMHAIAELRVPLNVIGIVPSSENLINGKAVKPGDVISSRGGKTIEVVNTDAEGRLILCDALDYARGMNPVAIVDCATLTGAVVIGLGHHAAAVLGTDEELLEELRRAGTSSGERCWPLPLWSEYRKQLESQVADLVNVGGRPGGTITAAAFLREFVGDVPWAHLDIAGTAYGTEPLSYQRKGAYGFPTRLLVEWVRSRVA